MGSADVTPLRGSYEPWPHQEHVLACSCTILISYLLNHLPRTCMSFLFFTTCLAESIGLDFHYGQTPKECQFIAVQTNMRSSNLSQEVQPTSPDLLPMTSDLLLTPSIHRHSVLDCVLRLGPQLNYKSAFYLRRMGQDCMTYFSTEQAVSQRIQDPVLSRTPQLSGRCLQANTDTLTHHGANTNGYSTAITHFYNRIPQTLLLLRPLLILSVFGILEYFPMLMPGYTKMSQLVFWNSRYFIKHRQST